MGSNPIVHPGFCGHGTKVVPLPSKQKYESSSLSARSIVSWVGRLTGQGTGLLIQRGNSIRVRLPANPPFAREGEYVCMRSRSVRSSIRLSRESPKCVRGEPVPDRAIPAGLAQRECATFPRSMSRVQISQPAPYGAEVEQQRRPAVYREIAGAAPVGSATTSGCVDVFGLRCPRLRAFDLLQGRNPPLPFSATQRMEATRYAPGNRGWFSQHISDT